MAVEAQYHSFLNSSLEAGRWLIHVSRYVTPPGNNPGYPFKLEACFTPDPVWIFSRREEKKIPALSDT
jgi:hypothetical protein